jgi:hypothetical protein
MNWKKALIVHLRSSANPLASHDRDVVLGADKRFARSVVLSVGHAGNTALSFRPILAENGFLSTI